MSGLPQNTVIGYGYYLSPAMVSVFMLALGLRMGLFKVGYNKWLFIVNKTLLLYLVVIVSVKIVSSPLFVLLDFGHIYRPDDVLAELMIVLAFTTFALIMVDAALRVDYRWRSLFVNFNIAYIVSIYLALGLYVYAFRINLSDPIVG